LVFLGLGVQMIAASVEIAHHALHKTRQS
jgi:hypothetical protein